MHSINLALDYKDTSSLIIFSDIIFEKHLIERLITSEEDITFLISPLDKNFLDIHSDKIVAKNDSKHNGRFLTNHKFNEILKIGKNLTDETLQYHFYYTKTIHLYPDNLANDQRFLSFHSILYP